MRAPNARRASAAAELRPNGTHAPRIAQVRRHRHSQNGLATGTTGPFSGSVGAESTFTFIAGKPLGSPLLPSSLDMADPIITADDPRGLSQCNLRRCRPNIIFGRLHSAFAAGPGGYTPGFTNLGHKRRHNSFTVGGRAMARTCEICGKGPQMGNQVTIRGKAKYLGGVGTKITGISRRQFKPNLQRVRVTVEGAEQDHAGLHAVPAQRRRHQADRGRPVPPAGRRGPPRPRHRPAKTPPRHRPKPTAKAAASTGQVQVARQESREPRGVSCSHVRGDCQLLRCISSLSLVIRQAFDLPCL